MLSVPLCPSAVLAEAYVFEYVRCALASCVTFIEYEPGCALPVVLIAIAGELEVPAKLPTPPDVLSASTALCNAPRLELMSESVEIAELVDVCLVLSAFRRPESAFTNPEMRLEVSIPDPTPLRLLSAMVPSSSERPDGLFLQRFLAFFQKDKAGQAADSEELAARTYL